MKLRKGITEDMTLEKALEITNNQIYIENAIEMNKALLFLQQFHCPHNNIEIKLGSYRRCKNCDKYLNPLEEWRL